MMPQLSYIDYQQRIEVKCNSKVSYKEDER